MVLDALAKVEKVAESSVRLKDQLTKKESEIQILSANVAFQKQKSNLVRIIIALLLVYIYQGLLPGFLLFGRR